MYGNLGGISHTFIPRVQLSVAPAAIPILGTSSPGALHVSRVQMLVIYRIYKPPIHPRTQGAKYPHGPHHPFLWNSCFAGSGLQWPTYLKQNKASVLLASGYLQDTKSLLIILRSPRNRCLTLGTRDGDVYISLPLHSYIIKNNVGINILIAVSPRVKTR